MCRRDLTHLVPRQTAPTIITLNVQSSLEDVEDRVRVAILLARAVRAGAAPRNSHGLTRNNDHVPLLRSESAQMGDGDEGEEHGGDDREWT